MFWGFNFCHCFNPPWLLSPNHLLKAWNQIKGMKREEYLTWALYCRSKLCSSPGGGKVGSSSVLPAFPQAAVILLLLKEWLDPLGLRWRTYRGVLVGQKCTRGEAPWDTAQCSLSLSVMNNAQVCADLSVQGPDIHRTQSTLSWTCLINANGRFVQGSHGFVIICSEFGVSNTFWKKFRMLTKDAFI